MIFAIDATNWGHVLWHAMRGRGVCDAFVRRLDAIWNQWGPEKIVCAFDTEECGFRRSLEPEYKAGRKPMDQELIDTLSRMFDAAWKWGAATVPAGEFEADDVLATVARFCVQNEYQAVLASPDKDLRQCLVENWCSILHRWKSTKGVVEAEWITAEKLFEKTGIRPDQWVDYQCIIGDSTDNIQGWEGVGPKSAAALLQKHGTLEQAIANPWNLTKVQAKTLPAFRARLPVVRQLVQLCDRVPLVADALDVMGAVV